MTDLGGFPMEVRGRFLFWKGMFPDGYFMLSEARGTAQKVRLGKRRVEEWARIDVRDKPTPAVLIRMIAGGEILSQEPDAFLDDGDGKWLYWKLSPCAFQENPEKKIYKRPRRRHN
jgi:hypothetical protein